VPIAEEFESSRAVGDGGDDSRGGSFYKMMGRRASSGMGNTDKTDKSLPGDGFGSFGRRVR
jgi:hypothetical protein